MKKLLAYFYPYRFLLIISVLLLFVAKGVEAFVPYYIGKMANVILADGFDFYSILNSGLFLALLLIASFVLEGGNVVLKTWMGQKALFQLRTDVYQKIQSLPVHYFDTHPVGQMMTRTIHDVDQINLMFSESLVPLLGSGFLFVSIVIASYFLDFSLFVLILFIIPLVFLLTNNFRINQRRCYDKIRQIVQEMNIFVQEYLMGAWTIRSFGLQKAEREKFEKLNVAHQEANIETIHYFATFFSGIDWIQGFSLVSIFAVLVFFSNQGFSPGVFFTFSLYVIMLFRPMADLAERYNVFQSAIAAADRIFHLLDEPVEVISGTRTLNQIDDICFEDVWFAYKGNEWVFKGLSFRLKRGEKIALVGMTGAGKSTVLKLLLRFYTIQKGKILINGYPIEEYDLNSLRKQFSVVLQDPELFSGTLKENITLYRPLEDLSAVIKSARLSDMVKHFPNGLDEPLLERGKSLSLGERQLVSIARAIAYNGSVFIFDEATANIDAENERRIQEALKEILSTKTTLVIAHRLSTIKDVDLVLVIFDGKVAEEGTHPSLLAKGGIYEKLYRLQFV